MGRKSKLLWIVALLMVSLVGDSWAQTAINSTNAFWIRLHGGGAYKSDGIAVWNAAKGMPTLSDDIRYGLLEFDLSGLGGMPVIGASLELFSAVHNYSDHRTPIKQTAYIIDCSTGTLLADLTWSTYMAEKDPGKLAMETLGRYDLPAANTDPAQQNAYVPSSASAADIGLIQNVINAGKTLCLVMIAEEGGTPFGRSWGDGVAVWSGGAEGIPQLVVVTPDGRAYNPNPASGTDFVLPAAALSWEVYLPLYSQTPNYTVYLSTNSDPNFPGVTPVSTSVANFDPPGNLASGTTYYWRVDVTDPNHGTPKVYKGDMWSFMTAPEYPNPTMPNPANGAIISAESMLSWESGSAALKHQVYLRVSGDDWTLVSEITAPAATQYSFSGQWDTPYEWKVVDTYPGDNIRESDIWSFRTLVPACNGGVRLPGDEDGDCYITLNDLAVIAANWLKCGWEPAGACGQWPAQRQGVTTNLEIWIRESAPDTTYENDAMTLYNNSVPEGRRAAMMDFNLSAYQGKTLTTAKLWLWQVGSWSSSAWPCKSHAFVVHPAQTLTGSMTWNAYINEYAGTALEIPLEKLGAYDLGAYVSWQMDTYVPSLSASAADLAVIQAIADTGGVLTISLFADDGPTQHRADFADDANFGHRAFLELGTE